ncbi:MAG TPA: CoA pyrophosphatase [Longimicrobiales bacterium]|nr:CoA pyrophosphatase [Longimicrobiales bacterium]
MPSGGLETDPRFWVLSEALASYAGDPDDPLLLEGDHLRASVALVLRARDPLEVLLIKRALSERDPWSGHMALPGGRRDSADADLRATALRETLEETGVDLAREGRPLGRLADVSPSSPRLPRLSISPFVFAVGEDVQAEVASGEVERVYWVPLDALRAPENRGVVRIPLPGGARGFPSFRVHGEHVWGLTYRILEQFLGVYCERGER